MNLPNKISMTRIIAIPFVMFFYLADFIPYGIGKIIGLVLFSVIALTDLLDGHIARSRGLVTDLGKFLDPIADKLLMTTGLLLVLADGTMLHPWGVIMTIIIIAREFIVSALRQIAATKKIVLAADMLGKIKANFQPVAIAFFMLLAVHNVNPFLGSFELAYTIICYVLMGIATILTIVSGVNYLVKNRAVFKEDKKEENK
jgi:CDP-diacylglycerol--glycerol-3-phosphate 3-phosphatidyltransferase